MVFRLQATHLALTYPRCDIPLEDLLIFLRSRSIGKCHFFVNVIYS